MSQDSLKGSFLTRFHAQRSNTFSSWIIKTWRTFTWRTERESTCGVVLSNRLLSWWPSGVCHTEVTSVWFEKVCKKKRYEIGLTLCLFFCPFLTSTSLPCEMCSLLSHYNIRFSVLFYCVQVRTLRIMVLPERPVEMTCDLLRGKLHEVCETQGTIYWRSPFLRRSYVNESITCGQCGASRLVTTVAVSFSTVTTGMYTLADGQND